jgi:hypothetical protein
MMVAVTAALLAGCGSGSPTPATTQRSGDIAQMAVAYAHCMQQHGVPNFPEPQVHTTPGGGSTGVSQVAPQSVVSSPAFKGAQKACVHLQPGPGSGPGPGGHGPGKQVFLAFARCLRAHGLESFPDPNAQGRITAAMISAAGVDIHGPGFLSTAKGCLGVTHGAITFAQIVAAVRHH